MALGVPRSGQTCSRPDSWPQHRAPCSLAVELDEWEPLSLGIAAPRLWRAGTVLTTDGAPCGAGRGRRMV